MNPLDRLVSWIDPVAGLRRRAARTVLASSYDAAAPSRLRKWRTDRLAPNEIVGQAALPLRAQARHLERNSDLARGIMRALVNNTVGAAGIGIEPQPRDANGEIHEAYATALREAWRDWCRCPEVTKQHRWPRVQRLMARLWLRDGEGFAQMLQGDVQYLDHGTAVPLSLELFEADMVPLDYATDRVKQGIERNAWGQRTGYYVYRDNPLEARTLARASDLKRIPAENMLHVANFDRIGQLRGVSEFASVITRLDDIKDYEESERIAAKIAAALTAYVKRGSPDLYDAGSQQDADGNPVPRDLNIAPGMIIDSLGVGEEIGLIDSKRPNPQVIAFRQGQLRAVAAGVGASYSSISRDYNGTYSAQRQELVEQWVHYAVLADDFVGQFVQPVWEAFVAIADASGVVPRPRAIAPSLADDALFVAQAMPWIDPLKEASAWESLVRAGFASEVEAIRRRGGNPRDVLDQIATFRKAAGDRGLRFSSDAATGAGNPVPSDQPAS